MVILSTLQSVTFAKIKRDSAKLTTNALIYHVWIGGEFSRITLCHQDFIKDYSLELQQNKIMY
jgi:hypothetical protein